MTPFSLASSLPEFSIVVEAYQCHIGGDAASESTEIVEINSQDAATRGIEDRQKIRLWKSLGEVVLFARVTNAEAPGVIYSPKGTWLKTSTTGQTFNALISADLKTDIMQDHCCPVNFR